MGGWAANIYGCLSTLGDDRRIFDKVGTYMLVTCEHCQLSKLQCVSMHVRVRVRVSACVRVGVLVCVCPRPACVRVCVPMHVRVRRLGACCTIHLSGRRLHSMSPTLHSHHQATVD